MFCKNVLACCGYNPDLVSVALSSEKTLTAEKSAFSPFSTSQLDS